MDLNNLKRLVGEINKQNGFHEKPFNLGEKLMLVNTELSECLEADRIDHHSDIKKFKEEYKKDPDNFKELFKLYIKEGVEAEVIDAMIRLFDLCYVMDIDVDTLFSLILKNNSLREYKHGKKY